MAGHAIALVVTIAASTMAPLPVAAQAKPLRELCIDRPGKDTPPCIVDKGHVVLETGAFLYSHDDETGTSEYQIGETLVRFGMTDTIELQLAWTPYAVVQQRDEITGRRQTSTGVGDLTGALKVNVLNPDGSGTSIAAQLFATAPTGHDEIGAGAWEGEIIVPLSFELSEATGLTLSPEVDISANESGSGHHLAYVGVMSLSQDLGGGVQGSAEIWSMIDHDPADHTTQASFDLALSWTPQDRSNLQFDVEADLGLTNATPAIQTTAGVAYRF